jgi:hypothetical protein
MACLPILRRRVSSGHHTVTTLLGSRLRYGPGYAGCGSAARIEIWPSCSREFEVVLASTQGDAVL